MPSTADPKWIDIAGWVTIEHDGWHINTERMREIAQGKRTSYDFSTQDWRPGSIPMMLWQAADELDDLRKQLSDFKKLKGK